MKPLCFIIMPFGKKKDADGNEIDFDEIYELLIHPAIDVAEMDPVRADEETVNGIIHKPMYERLILCDYAVADLTTANANVFYELGIRHAVKPYTTITIFASGSKLPFDLNAVRCLPYDYDKEKHLTNIKKNITALATQLKNAKKQKATDSPVYQLVDGISFQNSVAHEKTDIFRDKVEYDNKMKALLAKARNKEGGKAERIKAIEELVRDQINPEDEETGVLIDVMLSYRSQSAFDKMIAFIKLLPAHVQQTVMVQEQLGFALNRIGEKEEAIRVLEKIINENGPSSETYGILGRVYKDLFEKANEDKNELLAESYQDKAAETYLKGFEADWRDGYPGVNAITLLEVKGDQKSKEQVKKLAPVVEYAVIRKMKTKKEDYWDYATLLELAVIENDETKAKECLRKALACPIEGSWMFETTIKNLKLINENRKKRKEDNNVSESMIGLLQGQIAALG
ncbi:MAG TPA: TRAFs-binding domain-containing protein [Chitinophagaceae bacterium]|nr:TRAFs-binding domain-containing protein [Chitinophagaceae bacterium]